MTRRVGSLAPCLLFAVLAASAQADLPSDLQAITDGLAEETGVGALLCVEDAQGSFVLAAGSADSETPTAAKPTDRFRIASNGKSFTAAAILLLRDEGNLSLDDTVADLLPDHDIPSNDVITVRHLLTHTSGLPDHNNDTDYFESRALSNPATNFSPDEVFEVVRSLPSHFAPGEDWLYCDTGYYILHLIIEGENTNGWSYAEFIRHRLIEPLGLTNTFVPDDGNGFLRVIPGEHLDGYLLDEETGEITNVTEVGQSNDLGCGGMASSTEDLAKWIRALHDGAVLSAASQAEMETVTEQSRRTGHQYGMATVYSPLLGFGHSGVTLGYVSWMFYDPVRQTAYADVVNLESEDLLYTPMMALIEVKRALGYDDIADPRYSNTIAQVSAYVTNAMEEAGVPSLSIALVDSNRIVWARGFGLADREAGIEAHSDTTYLLCSISKTFTAAAILKLQEDGRVDLDDPVTNHIPDFALLPRFGGPPVTIRQLLNHSSGMPGTYWNRAATLSPDTNYHTFVLQQLAKDYPNFPPDFVNAYNNNGFTLVEDVVASASGTNFAAFVSGNLFAPMGMFGSTYFGAEPVARSYVNGVRYPDEIINVAGGGGIYSSALDMGQYIQTLLAWGRSPMDIAVLKSNSVSALWANETTNVSVPVTEKTFKFGLGWDCIADPEFDYAGTAPWKSGGSVTFGGLLEIIPSRGLGVIVFNNYPGGERVAHPVARAALRWALKDKFNLDWPTNRFVPLVSPVTNLPIAELDAVTGCYAIAGGYDLVQRDGTNLTWIGNAQSESPFIITNLVARENGWFSTPASQDIEICFSNVAGHVVMSLRQVIGTYGVYQDTSARGERIAPVALSAAWSNRLDRLYFMSDLVPDSYFWLPAFDISLRILPREDALFVEGDVVSSSLLVPDSDTLAFPRGLGLEAADATALQAFTTNGIEYLRYGGFTYQPADSYPEFEPETVTNLSLDAGEVMWFSMPITSGTVYTLDLTSTNLVAAYIIDTDGNRAGKILTAYGMTFTPLTDGDYRIAVFSDGADPTSCQLASYTNGLPFYRQVDAAEWPAALTNYLEWYGGAEFGYVYVPASRATNDMHSYRLPVVTLAGGSAATNGPLIYLSGGPGFPAIEQIYLVRPFTNICDVILLNQRGTYMSQPDLFPVSTNETTAELQARLGGPDGMDFNTVNTRENAADVHDVLTALGHGQFNVWALSYGTMLAQEVLRQHPERIRCVVLEGVVATDLPQPTTQGQAFYDAVQALTNDVGRSADANRLYPDFGTDLMDFAADLYPDGHEELFHRIFGQMNASRWGYVEDVPAIVWRAAQGEDAAWAGFFAVRPPFTNVPPGPLSAHMYGIINRHDMLPFESMTNAAALTNSIPFPLNEYGYDYSQNEYDSSEDWAFITPADASFREPVTNDVPVLVMNGQYDTQTSPAHARHVATNLPHAYYVEFPYIGHSTLQGGDVPAQIGRDFIVNPDVFPDTNGITGLSLAFSAPWGTNAIPLAADGAPRTNDWEWNGFGAVGAWYRFAAAAGERCAFEVGSPAVPFTLSVVTTNAEVIAAGEEPALAWTCPEAGDYYAWLVAATSGTFTVTLTGITNDLAEGDSVTGELAATRTTWFHCSTVSGRYYGVWVTGVTAEVSLQLVSESLGFVTNRNGGWLGWTSLDDGGYDVGLLSTGDTPFVLRFYSLTNTIAVTRAAVTGYMDRFDIPGVSVALVDGDAIAWIEHFGFANAEEARPVDSNTVFMIGSLSKTLTTLTALTLVDESALDLDASVTNYIPEFSLLPRFAGFPTNITPRNMLDHHSGLPGDIYNGAVSLLDRYWPGYTAWLLGYFAEDYALYPPDTIASYCNSGFNIVAEIVARLDGTNFPASAEARVFGPLEMAYSSYLPDKTTITENLATGYDDDEPSPDLVMNMPATGGAYSRAEDIAHVMIMLLNEGRYLGQFLWTTNALAQMGRTADAPLDVGSYSQCGLGLDSARDPALSYGGRTWAKNGSTGFFESFMEVLPDQGLGCIALMNTSPEATYGIVRTALKAALEEKAGLVKPPIPPMDFTPTNRPYAELQPMEGLYVTRSGPEQFVAETNGTLTSILIGLSGNTVSTGYQALVNGRFAVPGHTNLQCAFTNIAGEDLIVRCGDDGSLVFEMILDHNGTMIHGSRFVPPPVSAAWSNRLGATWLACNQLADDAMALYDEPPKFRLHLTNGILRVGTTVLEPADDDTAYVAGLVTRADGAVRILHTNGAERLQFNGYRCMRLEDIPELTPGTPVDGTNLFHEGNWYVMNLPAGTYTLTCSDTNITLLFYADLDNDPAVAIGTHTFALTTPGTAYVALVTMSASLPYELDAGRATLLIEQVQAGPSGMVLTWISQPGTNYAIELATNLAADPAFAPGPGGIPSVAGIRTSWTAAPSSGAAYYRVAEEP